MKETPNYHFPAKLTSSAFPPPSDTLIPTVAAGEAGVGVVQCRGDYLVMAGTRLCGDRLNDGSQEPQPTNNGPVTGEGRGAGRVEGRGVRSMGRSR